METDRRYAHGMMCAVCVRVTIHHFVGEGWLCQACEQQRKQTERMADVAGVLESVQRIKDRHAFSTVGSLTTLEALRLQAWARLKKTSAVRVPFNGHEGVWLGRQEYADIQFLLGTEMLGDLEKIEAADADIEKLVAAPDGELVRVEKWKTSVRREEAFSRYAIFVESEDRPGLVGIDYVTAAEAKNTADILKLFRRRIAGIIMKLEASLMVAESVGADVVVDPHRPPFVPLTDEQLAALGGKKGL